MDVASQIIVVLGIVNAAAFANGEVAPPGFHWDFVTDDLTGERVTDDVTGTLTVDLVGN